VATTANPASSPQTDTDIGRRVCSTLAVGRLVNQWPDLEDRASARCGLEIVGPGIRTPILDQAWVQEMREEPDPRCQLKILAAKRGANPRRLVLIATSEAPEDLGRTGSGRR
jgi:hypothetical protein